VVSDLTARIESGRLHPIHCGFASIPRVPLCSDEPQGPEYRCKAQGRSTRSSDEGFVMKLEQRGCIVRFD